MTTYSSKNLNEYLGLVAAEKKVPREELRKNISLHTFQIIRGGSFAFPDFLKAEKELKEFVGEHGYDAVVDIKRNLIPEFFGLEYKISATGVKFKEN